MNFQNIKLLVIIFQILNLSCMNQFLPENIVKAALNNQVDIIKKYLDQGGNIETITKQKSTLLYLSCLRGNIRLTEFLIRKKANVNSEKNPLIATLIYYKKKFFSTNITLALLKLLVDNGSKINDEINVKICKSYNITYPNIIACLICFLDFNSTDDFSIFDFFIKNGAEFDIDHCLQNSKSNKNKRIISYFEDQKIKLQHQIKESSLFANENDKICNLISEYLFENDDYASKMNKAKCIIQ